MTTKKIPKDYILAARKAFDSERKYLLKLLTDELDANAENCTTHVYGSENFKNRLFLFLDNLPDLIKSMNRKVRENEE